MVTVVMGEQNSVAAAFFIGDTRDAQWLWLKIGVQAEFIAHIDHNACFGRFDLCGHASDLMCPTMYDNMHHCSPSK